MKQKKPKLNPLPPWLKKVSPWHMVAVFSMLFLWAVILLPSTQTETDDSTPYVDPLQSQLSNLERVNAHLQYLEQKAELRELKAKHEIPEPEQIDPRQIHALPQYNSTEYRRFEEADLASEVYEDMHGSRRKFDTPLTPEERINAALANKRWVKDYEENQKNEFIRNFIENARSQGYEVELNDQLEVVNIREIPTNKRYRGLGSIKNLDF